MSKIGWKTDRGRVLILYGEPNEIERFPNQMDKKPYEIWHYDDVEGGVIFVFADLSGFSFMRRVPWEIVYEDDIYVGYRYYNTFKIPVAYEFGYGLSYTKFDYSNMKLSTTDFTGQLTVSVAVKNTGSIAGREVIQLYISSPNGKLKKPEETLAAFGKTKLLKPGESQTISFKIETKDFASFDEATSSWVAEAGKYNLKIGNSSLSVKQAATFTIAKELQAGKISKSLVPTREISKMTSK